MKIYITIDGGTTSTRVSLVSNKIVKQTVKPNIGAGKNLENSADYKTEIKKAVEKLITDNGLLEKDITRILASGMITSEYGLCSLEHISAPVGIQELHERMFETVIPEISTIPFVFVRGVKIISEDIGKTDMMRGEETELIGLIGGKKEQCLYVLPGSHSKLIFTDDNGRIERFSTMLTGEMIFALSQSTILKDAVDLSISETDLEYLLYGDKYCTENGINKALFKVRILKNLFGATPVQCYSFFLGVVLCGENSAIRKSGASKVVIGGKSQIKSAMAKILEATANMKIIIVPEKNVEECTALGLTAIYEYEM